MSDNIDELGVNGEFEEDGREIVLDTSGEVELTDEATEGSPSRTRRPKSTRLNSSRRSCASVACVSRGMSSFARSCANFT